MDIFGKSESFRWEMYDKYCHMYGKGMYDKYYCYQTFHLDVHGPDEEI